MIALWQPVLVILSLSAAWPCLAETTICGEDQGEIRVSDANIELIFVGDEPDGRDYTITFPHEVDGFNFEDAFLVFGDPDSPDFATRLETYISESKSIDADFYAAHAGFKFSVIASYGKGCDFIHVQKDFET